MGTRYVRRSGRTQPSSQFPVIWWRVRQATRIQPGFRRVWLRCDRMYALNLAKRPTESSQCFTYNDHCCWSSLWRRPKIVPDLLWQKNVGIGWMKVQLVTHLHYQRVLEGGERNGFTMSISRTTGWDVIIIEWRWAALCIEVWRFSEPRFGQTLGK